MTDARRAGRRRRMRVLMATPRFLPDMGGVETHVYEVGRRLRASGVDVAVVCADTTRERPRRQVLEGIEIIRLPAYPSGRDWCITPGLGRVVRSGGWDLVHVQSYHTALAPHAMAEALASRIPYVVSFHAGGHSGRLRGAVRPAQQRALGPLLRRARRLVVLADFEVGVYGTRLDLGSERFTTIPNGADLPGLAPDRIPERDPGLIASVGRLERYKGHHRAIAALPHVLARRPDARLWIAGSGPFESSLREQASRLGVADRVEIRSVPPGDREAMAAEVSRASLVVLLSEFETQPLAALEAIALGRRVVVADNSGLTELAERGWARAVPLEERPAGLASTMVEEMGRPPLADPPAMATWDDCARGLHDLYREVVGG